MTRVRFRKDGKSFVAEYLERDYAISQQMRVPLGMYLIYDTSGKTNIGCVSFSMDMLSGFSWGQRKENHPINKTPQFCLPNLLPHLPLNIEEMKDWFSNHSWHCIVFCFDSKQKEGKSEKEGEEYLYYIKPEDSLFETARRIMYGDSEKNEDIQATILEILYNYWEDYPDTKMLYDQLLLTIPVEEVVLKRNLNALIEDKRVDPLLQNNEAKPIVSIKITSEGRKIVEGRANLGQGLQNNVTTYDFGHKINVRTGDYSPVTINADMVDVVFNGYKYEIEQKNLKNKEVLTEAVTILQEELKKKDKDSGKVKKALQTIAGGAGWLYEKITNNQLIGTVLAQIALQQMGLPPRI